LASAVFEPAHAMQPPVHAVSQQKPSTQAPVEHWEGSVQAAPCPFTVVQTDPRQKKPEVQSAFWVSFHSLQAAGARTSMTVDHPGIPTQVLPAYAVGKHLVWGMSERILTPLISLVS